MVAATLCGITDPEKVKRSVCAAGHKWFWNHWEVCRLKTYWSKLTHCSQVCGNS
jgi:L-ribulokinase